MFRKKVVAGLVLTALISAWASESFAVDLQTAFKDAVQNDPAFKAASSQLASDRERLSQARSGLFPIVLTQGSQSLSNEVRTRQGTDAATRTARNDVKNYSVSLTQPVFDFGVWMGIRQARAEVKQAVATYKAAQQDLIIRLSNAYFAILEAQDNLRFTVAEKKANSRQLAQAKERYKVGLDAITSVYDAQASYDAVVSREIIAENAVSNTFEALRAITGKRYDSVSPLVKQLPLLKPNPLDKEKWVQAALRQNYTALASRYAADAARHAIRVSIAANLPVFNVVARYAENNGANFGAGSTDTETKSVNVEVDMPIFQGGNTISVARQAKANYQTALANADGSAKNTISATRQAYNSVMSGIGTVKADRQAVKSAKSVLESTEAAYRVGTRTIVDVLDRQRELFDQQRVLAADQYTYIRDTLLLKQAAGILSVEDIHRINTWLKGNPKRAIRHASDQQRLLQHPIVEKKRRGLFRGRKKKAIDRHDQHLLHAGPASAAIVAAPVVATKATTSPVKLSQTRHYLRRLFSFNKAAKPTKTTSKNVILVKKPSAIKQRLAKSKKPIVARNAVKSSVVFRHAKAATAMSRKKSYTQHIDDQMPKIYLQVASVASKKAATKMAARLRQAVKAPVKVTADKKHHYAVRIGPLARGSSAYDINNTLEKKGFGEAMVVIN